MYIPTYILRHKSEMDMQSIQNVQQAELGKNHTNQVQLTKSDK